MSIGKLKLVVKEASEIQRGLNSSKQSEDIYVFSPMTEHQGI